MSLTSFLTQDPMQYAPTSSQSSTSLPDWYNSYAQGILQNAAQFANQGYQPYGGPRIASLTPDQLASYGTVQGTQGLGQGIAQQGVSTVNSALAQPNASQAAQPYLSAASTPLSTSMQSFMNPYLNDVANNANTIANRNFTENVLPALQDQFTQAGQVYGGSRQGEYAERMARDLNLNNSMTTANTMAQGFNTALGGAATQAGINAGLGSTAGQLANATQNTGIAAGANLGNLGTTAQNNALTQAFAQNQMGQQQQNQTQQNLGLAYNDFLQQQYQPLIAAQAMQSGLSGIQVPTGSTNYNYAPYGYGMGPLAQAGSIYGGLNSLFGTGGSLTGAARGGPIRLARGGRATLTLPRRAISPLAQYSKAA